MPSGLPLGGEPSRREAWRRLRASDADRDRVVDLLRGAMGDGRLTAGEFTERMAAALAARTYGDLAALTGDLAAAPARLQDVVRIGQRGGSVRRGGRWLVPRRLELRCSWCDVLLDFTGAAITHNMLRIHLHMRGGSLVLVTRPGIVVDADDLSMRGTDVKVADSADPGTPVILRVHLTGRMRYGWIGAR